MVRRGQITIDDSLNLQGGLAVSSSPAPVSADALIIKNAACQLLERVGIAISHQATRQAVIANGAQPLPSGRVAITTAMVDEALQTAPHRLHRVARQ
ncbi:MAG: trimethylamine methyltransferase family protein, partial [Alphaproteobacteria bacterium]|nr:trimethylamine methyltransferase family protein [Alphaproteobacteria bacterium]